MNSSNTTSNNKTNQVEVKNGFQIPKWSGKPPSGLHLDVMKDGKMIQKLMIDEKNCYFFGRNKDSCDFVIDHASCSRVHAVLLWHKHLNRSFLIDLNSTHGTFIGSLRLESNKPQQVFVDSELKFGASTRSYIIRERPQTNKHFPSILNNSTNSINDSSIDEKEDSFNQSLNLPESEAELDNLTEFNTAHNKRIAQLVDITTTNSTLPTNIPSVGPIMVRTKKKSVTFNDEEDVINPEDVDPSIGRFRNLVQTTIIIPKKKRPSQGNYQTEVSFGEKRARSSEIISSKIKDDSNDSSEEHSNSLYDEYEYYGSVASNMGIKSLNLAPDVEINSSNEPSILEKQQQRHLEMIHRQHNQQHEFEISQQQQHLIIDGKKKYAKESWPGRHPGSSQVTSSNTITVSPPRTISSHSPTRSGFTLTSTLKPSPTSSNPTQAPSATTNPPAKRLII